MICVVLCQNIRRYLTSSDLHQLLFTYVKGSIEPTIWEHSDPANEAKQQRVCAFFGQISPFSHLFGRPECVSLAEKCLHLEVPLDYELIEP